MGDKVQSKYFWEAKLDEDRRVQRNLKLVRRKSLKEFENQL
jgi:uncharacterized protein involved in tolerance to divalent cations